MKHGFVRALIAGALLLAVQTAPVSAQTTFRACRVPAVGVIYMIGVSGAPSACLDASHVEFQWTEGGAPADNTITSAKITDGTIATIDVADGAVTSAKIADGTIATADVANGAITQAKIDAGVSFPLAAGAVGTTELADNAVTSAKIAAGTVASADLASGSVTSTAIADGTVATADVADAAITQAKIDPGVSFPIAAGAVGTTELADNAVTGAKIADGSIQTAELALDVVGSAQVADNSLTAFDLADDAVGSPEIVNGGVTTDDIADGTIASADLAADAVVASAIANNAVTIDKLEAPPIVAYLSGLGYVLSGSHESVGSVTITAATNGVILLVASGTSYVPDEATLIEYVFGTSAGGGFVGDLNYTGHIGGADLYDDYAPVTLISTIAVSAGTYTYHLNARMYVGASASLFGVSLRAIFIPT